jgi:hypothetical protein
MDPEPAPDPEPSINKGKKEGKPWFLLFCDFFMTFLSLKNHANGGVPSKRNKHKNLEKKIIFCWHLEGHRQKEQDLELDPCPDPLDKGTDLRIRIRIRTKISRILYTEILDHIQSFASFSKSSGLKQNVLIQY